MIDFDAFLPLVEPNAIAAPEALIFQSLRLAAIRFSERTRMWRDYDTISTDGIDPEPVSVPNDSVLFEVAACAQSQSGGDPSCGKPLDPVTLAFLAEYRPTWRTEPVDGCGSSRWYVCPTFGTVQAVPRSPGTLTVETVLKPSATALTLPDFLFDQYGTDIANGASGLVLSKPDASFGNPQLAGALMMRFEQRLGTLSNMGSAGQQKAKARTRARFM